MEVSLRSYDSLSTTECLSALGESSLGRVAYWDGGPVVIPVVYVVDGDSVVFRTDELSRLASVGIGARIALEIDETEPALHSGSSVLVKGVAERVVGDRDDLRSRLLQWAPGVRDCLVALSTSQVTGRRISPGPGGTTVVQVDSTTSTADAPA